MAGAPQPGRTGFIPIAEVDRVRGLAGEVVVTVHADDPSRMARLSCVFLREAGEYRRIAVEGVKRLGGRAVLKLAGFGSREEARRLVGKELFIPPQASTPAPLGRYYAYQLVGLVALLMDGSPVGTVREVRRQGAQSLLVLQTRSGGECLVPFVRAICVEIDTEGGTLKLDPPDGLLDLNSGSGKQA